MTIVRCASFTAGKVMIRGASSVCALRLPCAPLHPSNVVTTVLTVIFQNIGAQLKESEKVPEGCDMHL